METLREVEQKERKERWEVDANAGWEWKKKKAVMEGCMSPGSLYMVLRTSRWKSM